jgi:hypothetical protein
MRAVGREIAHAAHRGWLTLRAFAGGIVGCLLDHPLQGRTMSAGSSLDVRFHREGPVLVAAVNGALTVAVMRQLRRDVTAELARQDARCVVLDITRALHALTREGWCTVANEACFDNPITKPVAIVVNSMSKRAVREHCLRMRRRGRVRLTATSLDAAVCWASSWPVEQPTGLSSEPATSAFE